MPRTHPGSLDGRRLRVGVVVARWNPAVTDRLLEGALATLAACGVPDDAVSVVEVPGAFEIALAARRLAASGRVDAVVTLGCVLKGETIHDEVLAHACARGVLDASLSTGVPVTFGVVTADTEAQARARSDVDAPTGGKGGHKGREAAEAAVRLATALADWERSS